MSAIYARLEKDQARSYSASFDLTAGLDRFMTWLDDHPGGEPPDLAAEPAPAAGGIRFRILGPLEVRTGQDWQAIGAPKWRALLAALLISPGQVVTTARLVSEVWGADRPARPERLISIYVLRLRRLIGDSSAAVLTARQDGYELRAGHGELDAAVFAGLVEQGRQALAAGAAERASALLAEALGLWRGSPLADVPPTPLIADASARLQRDRLAAVMLRVESEIACGRAGEVISELGRMVLDQPHRQDWRELLVRALDQAGRPGEELTLFQRLRDIEPADPGSEATYRQAIRLDPGDAAAHHGLGRALSAQDRYAEAVASYQEAIRLSPADPAAYVHLGVALLFLDRSGEGAAAFREAIRLDPASAATHVQLGDALAAQNLHAEAESAYREAIRLDPADAGTFSRLGYVLAEQERYTEAVAAYREAIRLDPADALSCTRLSGALREQRD